MQLVKQSGGVCWNYQITTFIYTYTPVYHVTHTKKINIQWVLQGKIYIVWMQLVVQSIFIGMIKL